MRVCPRCRSIFTGESEFCSLDGQQLVDGIDDPLIGERIDRYEFVERLGTGAMGVVYRVRHTELDRDFAIKVLYGEFGANKSLVARFRREAKAMSRMNHPNVVSVVDFGATEHGLNFLVMERIDGRTLEAVLEERRIIPPRHAAWIARQVAAGLGEAHRLGFVHRDVKPANIMLSGVDGREHIKVLDFGIVGITDAAQSTKLTGTGRIVGTPRYMSPEQARDANVDPPADLYSLGVILYEMLSGDVPFPGDILADVLVLHSTADHSPLPRSEGLEHIVDGLLVKRFEDRIQTAAEVVARLDACFGDLAPSFPSFLEDDIPTERPRAASDPRHSDELEVPPLAEDETPLIPFPRSNSSLEPVRDDRGDASIYDCAPDAPAVVDDDDTLAALAEPAFSDPRETSGFDRPGEAGRDVLSVSSSIGSNLDGVPTYGGVSDQFARVVSPEPPRRRGGVLLIAASVVSLVALGVVIALPNLVELREPARPARVAVAAAPLVLPTLEFMDADHRPVAAGVEPAVRRVRRVRRRRNAAATAPDTAPPRLSVSELEVALGHVLARRGLALADLPNLRATRVLARSWRRARDDQTEAEAITTLGNLIEATRTAPITRRMLIRKSRRARARLDEARPTIPPKTVSAFDKRLRALEYESRKVKSTEYERLAHALTGFEVELAAALTGP